MPVHEHHQRAGAAKHLSAGLITASDTRTAANDDGGQAIRELLERAGHKVTHYAVVPDDRERIGALASDYLARADLVIITGGTGVAARDSTIEAVRPLLDKELEGFGELFRMLAYQEIGAAAILSRALAGIARGRILIALPGSPAACKLALEKLIIPELGHLAHLLNL
jgi:molybdenum cofactor biosynthesis protein B